MAKRINNREKIMSALLVSRNDTEASQISGVSTRTISRAKENPDFIDELNQRRKEILDSTCMLLQSQIQSAILTAVDIMNNEKNSAQVRLNASDLIIRNTYRLTELTDTKVKLAEIQERLNELNIIDS